MRKYWLSLLLLLLTAVSFFSPQVALLTAFVFTLIVPGLLFLRFFKLDSHEVWALVPVLSVLVSTQLVYYASLVVGYSKESILLCFLVLTVAYTLVTWKKGEVLPLRSIPSVKRIKKTTLLVLILIFAVSLAVLLRSVWLENQNGIVITGSNWQDTPLHYEIIESLNNGNFPPQMPYFAGEKMSYHYFVDFHTAILEKVYGFLPTLLPFLNAVFGAPHSGHSSGGSSPSCM